MGKAGELNYPLIDVLRAFAAISVIILHTIALGNWVAFPDDGLLGWFRDAANAVDLFFVISGFVVFLSAYGLWRQYRWGYLWRFAARRMTRLAPLHWVTCLVALLTVETWLFSNPTWPMHLAMHLGFVHTATYETYSSINGVNWSIAIEAQFYLLVALTFPLLLRLNAMAVLVGACLLAWAWRWGAAITTPADDDYRLFTRYSQLPGLVDTFAFGIVLARFAIGGGVEWLQRRRFSMPLLLALTIALVWLFVYPRGVTYFTREGFVAFEKTGLGLAFAFVVLLACLLSDNRHVMAITAPLRFLGKISYGLYLWHLIVLMALKGVGLDPVVLLGLTLLCTMALASLSYYAFELPLVKMARNLTGSSPAAGSSEPRAAQ